MERNLNSYLKNMGILKKIFLEPIKIRTILIFVIILTLSIIYLLKDGNFGMGPETPGTRLTETYLKIGDYKIGKQKYFYNICHKDKLCLQGEILGLEQENDKIYLYIKINHSTFGAINIKTGIFNIHGYHYKFYFGENRRRTANTEKDLPKFGYLSGNNLNFYSENDLKNLPKEKQEIFREIEKNPTIVINGKKYK